MPGDADATPLSGGGGEVSHWPGCEGAPKADLRRAQCPGCTASWLAHRDLVGFRIRCTHCGTMVPIPSTAADRARWAEPPAPPALPAPRRGPNLPAVQRAGRDGQLPAITSGRDRGGGMLIDASVRERSRWTNATVLEVVLILVALIGPQLLIEGTVAGRGRLYARPLASIIGGVLILLIGLKAPAYAFGGLRLAGRGRHLFEAILAIPGFVLLASLYVALVVQLPGVHRDAEWTTFVTETPLPLLIFMVGICPGIFEEIAFRGLVQSRLTALYGLGLGLTLTATFFALAHGVTGAFPIHVLLGFYLCWLRLRSASLVPGILFHMGYNTCVILIDRSGWWS